MSELAYIARDFGDRRSSIFEDIDRKDGPIWSQLFVTCLAIIRSVEQRIDSYGKPPPPPAAPQPVDAQAAQSHPRAAQPPKTEDVWRQPAPIQGVRGSVVRAVDSVTRTTGKTPAEIVGPQAIKHAQEMKDRLLTDEQKELLSTDGVSGGFRALGLWFVRIPFVGYFFQQTFGRRLVAAVLGLPYGELSVYANAAFALSQLAVSSLTEDKYGNVQRDVPELIRTFTIVIKKLERFRDKLPEHWTDVEHDRRSGDFDQLLDAFKTALGRLLEAFGPYSTDLRLSRADMRLAREAAVKQPAEREDVAAGRVPEQRGPEMRQVA